MKRNEGDIWFRNGEKVIKFKGKIKTYYRYLVEHYIGFELPEGYTVHHLNEDHTDNRIENLCVIPTKLHVWIHRTGKTKNLLESNLKKIRDNPSVIFQESNEYRRNGTN